VTNDAPETHEVFVEDNEGRTYLGRITGSLIAQDGYVSVFRTNDGRVLVYNESASKYLELDEPIAQLRQWLGNAAYADAVEELGETPVIDL
jgi:hypothetical protein